MDARARWRSAEVRAPGRGRRTPLRSRARVAAGEGRHGRGPGSARWRCVTSAPVRGDWRARRRRRGGRVVGVRRRAASHGALVPPAGGGVPPMAGGSRATRSVGRAPRLVRLVPAGRPRVPDRHGRAPGSGPVASRRSRTWEQAVGRQTVSLGGHGCRRAAALAGPLRGERVSARFRLRRRRHGRVPPPSRDRPRGTRHRARHGRRVERGGGARQPRHPARTVGDSAAARPRGSRCAPHGGGARTRRRVHAGRSRGARARLDSHRGDRGAGTCGDVGGLLGARWRRAARRPEVARAVADPAGGGGRAGCRRWPGG